MPFLRRERKSLLFLTYLFFVLVVLIFNAAVIVTVLTSFKTNADINSSPPRLFSPPTLEHYSNVFSLNNGAYKRYIANSFLYSLLSALGAILISFPAAYSVVRYKIGTKILFPFITNLRALPLIVFVIPIYLIYDLLGLLDRLSGLVIIGILINIPLAFVMFVASLQEIPESLEEAAFIDGASLLKTLAFIVFPLSLPTILTCAILSFIYSWNEFLFALILSTEKAITATVGATFFISQYGVKWGDISAAIVLSILPILLVSLLAFPYIGKGMTKGAVKG